jgi:diadenylate cyclase
MKIGFLEFNWNEVLDLVLVAFLLYYIYKLLQGSGANRIFLGCLFVYVFYLIVRHLRLELLTRILEYFMSVGALALIVLFQQEIRRFLLLIGKTTSLTNNRFLGTFFTKQAINQNAISLKAIHDAIKTLSHEFNGCLIILQKNDDLSKYSETGDLIDGILSKRLLLSIFGQYSPLNDGAVIINQNRIKAAHCVLPITSSDDLPASYGFRHRAALGISEVTDALAIVVSENSGKISLAVDGKLKVISVQELDKELKKYFI